MLTILFSFQEVVILAPAPPTPPACPPGREPHLSAAANGGCPVYRRFPPQGWVVGSADIPVLLFSFLQINDGCAPGIVVVLVFFSSAATLQLGYVQMYIRIFVKLFEDLQCHICQLLQLYQRTKDWAENNPKPFQNALAQK